LRPRPPIHADLTPLAAFAAADEDRAASRVEVALLERKRLADPAAGAPQKHDQRAEPLTVRAVAHDAHHGDDFLDGRRVGRVVLALVARWAAAMVAGHCRG
jgi:hypothetical protein